MAKKVEVKKVPKQINKTVSVKPTKVVNKNVSPVKGKQEKFTVGKITFVQVKSSNLAGYSYNEKEKTLYVKFNNGRVYKYTQVPKSRIMGIANAPSKGIYFKNFIKFKYNYEEM